LSTLSMRYPSLIYYLITWSRSCLLL